VPVFEVRSMTLFCRIWAGGIFSKRTSMPVSALNCGATVIRFSK
jgi:hypothetical protein